MFWREQKAAIASFHPLHQALVFERGFSATQPAAGWSALVASLHRHAGLVRRGKWALPPRTLDVLVPVILEVSSDLGPRGTLSIAADLRGPDAPGKAGPPVSLPCRKPIRAVTETRILDPWLRLRAELRDGSVLEVLVADRVRRRKIDKRTPRGKYKSKRKVKITQVVKVRRRLPEGVTGRVPATPPPAWIGSFVREGRRRSILSAARLSRLPQSGQEQVDLILRVATEPFRWTGVS